MRSFIRVPRPVPPVQEDRAGVFFCKKLLSHPPEVSLYQLMADLEAQDPPLDDRVVIMESGIDPREFDFVHKVIGASEDVGLSSDLAIHGECEVRGPEVPCENGCDDACDATVRRRVLWVAGGIGQR